MKLKGIIKVILTLGFTLLSSISVSADEVPSPDSSGVYDPKIYLSDKTKNLINKYNSDNEVKIGVYVDRFIDVPNLESYSLKVAEKWGIGTSKDEYNKGILVMFGFKDKKWVIRTSKYVRSHYLSEREAEQLVGNVKYLLRDYEYDKATYKLVESIYSKIDNPNSYKYTLDDVSHDYNKEQGKRLRKVYDKLMKNSVFKVFVSAMFSFVVCLFSAIGLHSFFDKKKRRERSNFNYIGFDKLEPNDKGFIPNYSWSESDLEEYKKNICRKLKD